MRNPIAEKKWWSSRDSNPGPDKETLAPSTCLASNWFSCKPRLDQTFGFTLSALVSPESRSFLQTSFTFRCPWCKRGKTALLRDNGYCLIPRLSSHGVRIFAIYCLNGFLTGGLFNSRHAYTESAQAVNSGLPHKLKNVVPFQYKSAKILFSIRSITFFLG